MKKAFIDRLLFGFIILFSTITFIATVNDDRTVKNKYLSLEDIANESINALGEEYFRNMQGDLTNANITTMNAICLAQAKVNNLLNASDLGKELLDNNQIQYVWRDAGVYNPDTESYNGGPDGYPDTISAVISDYQKNTFWYRFIGKKSFTLPGFTRAVDLNRFTFNVDVSFRGVINAGYYNMVGTYTLDANGCPQDAQLVLDNKDDWENKIGQKIVNIEMPKTKMFFIADGYRRFGKFDDKKGRNSTISLENTQITFDNGNSTDCKNGTTYPNIIITTDDGKVQRSDDAHSSLTSRANVYFQDEHLNFDNEEEHINEIAEKDWGAFVALMEEEAQWNQEAKDYYNSLPSGQKTDNKGIDLKKSAGNIDDWNEYVKQKKLTPKYDPANEYVFISEDLASTTNRNNDSRGIISDNHDDWNSDRDFSDMSFSMKKIFVPEPIDPKTITSDSIINVICP